jgi:hypothetical protein
MEPHLYGFTKLVIITIGLCTKRCCYLEEFFSAKADTVITIQAYLSLLSSILIRNYFLTYVMTEEKALDLYELI